MLACLLVINLDSVTDTAYSVPQAILGMILEHRPYTCVHPGVAPLKKHLLLTFAFYPNNEIM